MTEHESSQLRDIKVALGELVAWVRTLDHRLSEQARALAPMIADADAEREARAHRVAAEPEIDRLRRELVTAQARVAELEADGARRWRGTLSVVDRVGRWLTPRRGAALLLSAFAVAVAVRAVVGVRDVTIDAGAAALLAAAAEVLRSWRLDG